MSDNYINDYELVHRVAKRTNKKEIEERNEIAEKKNEFLKTINKKRKKKNLVLEAFEEETQANSKGREEC